MSHLRKYMEPTVPEKLMVGKGARKPSLFGVIGNTKLDTYTKSLGRVVSNTRVSPYPHDPSFKPSGINTVNGILGKNATHISPQHYSQVPYAGKFMARAGVPL